MTQLSSSQNSVRAPRRDPSAQVRCWGSKGTSRAACVLSRRILQVGLQVNSLIYFFPIYFYFHLSSPSVFLCYLLFVCLFFKWSTILLSSVLTLFLWTNFLMPLSLLLILCLKDYFGTHACRWAASTPAHTCSSGSWALSPALSETPLCQSRQMPVGVPQLSWAL